MAMKCFSCDVEDQKYVDGLCEKCNQIARKESFRIEEGNVAEMIGIVQDVDKAIAAIDNWTRSDDSVLPSYIAVANGWRFFVMLSPPDVCDGGATKGNLIYHLTPNQRGLVRRSIEKMKNGNSHS